MELAKTNKELSTLKTSKSKVVQAFEQPKIYTLTEIEDLKNTIKYIFVLVGLRETPSKEEFMVLIDYIKTNYTMYSLQELKLAFQLALKKEFVVEINHYGLFSPSYFSVVMYAYSEYREQIAKDYMRDNQKQKDLDNQNKEVSPEKIERLKKEFYRDVLKPLFIEYKNSGRLMFGYVPVRLVYESLKNDYDVLNISDKHKEEIKENAYLEVQDKHKYCKLTGDKKTKKEMWKELCQVKAIEISFNKLNELK
jgi:hypothetical protein